MSFMIVQCSLAYQDPPRFLPWPVAAALHSCIRKNSRNLRRIIGVKTSIPQIGRQITSGSVSGLLSKAKGLPNFLSEAQASDKSKLYARIFQRASSDTGPTAINTNSPWVVPIYLDVGEIFRSESIVSQNMLMS